MSDKLHELHMMVIVDLNSAKCYLEDAREAFTSGLIQDCKELIGRSLRETNSVLLNIKELEKRKQR